MSQNEKNEKRRAGLRGLLAKQQSQQGVLDEANQDLLAFDLKHPEFLERERLQGAVAVARRAVQSTETEMERIENPPGACA